MEIQNAIIKNVTVGLDDRDRLSAMISFESQGKLCTQGFILTNPNDTERLIKIMSYTGSSKVEQFKGKIVRVVNHDFSFQGFGNPIEDKFVPIFGDKLNEITEDQFEELLKTK